MKLLHKDIEKDNAGWVIGQNKNANANQNTKLTANVNIIAVNVRMCCKDPTCLKRNSTNSSFASGIF